MPRSAGLLALCAGAALCAQIAVAVPAGAAPRSPVVSSVPAAAKIAQAAGYRTGVAVLDLATGRYTGAGDDSSAFASESVVKVLIATELLATGQMTADVEPTARRMITASDDAAATALYPRVGGDAVVQRVAARYGIADLGSPPGRAGRWGNTQITARGLVFLYAAIARDPVVGPWLMAAMGAASAVAADGTSQLFGLPAATAGAAVKQGWGHDSAGARMAVYASTGFVEGGRFAVAVLTEGPDGTYGAPIADIVTAEARALLPGGHLGPDVAGGGAGAAVPAVVPLMGGAPAGAVDSVEGGAGMVTVTGQIFDPALPTGRSPTLTVSVDGGPPVRRSAGPQLALPGSGAGSVSWSDYALGISVPTGRHRVTIGYLDTATGRGVVRGTWQVTARPTPAEIRRAALARAGLLVLALLALGGSALAVHASVRWCGRLLSARAARRAERQAVRRAARQAAAPALVRLPSGAVVRLPPGSAARLALAGRT